MRFGNFLFFYTFCGALALPPPVSNPQTVSNPAPVSNTPYVPRGGLLAQTDVVRTPQDFQSCVNTILVLGHSSIDMTGDEWLKSRMKAELLKAAQEGCREEFPDTAPPTSSMRYPDVKALMPAVIHKPKDFESCVRNVRVLMSSSTKLVPRHLRAHYKQVLEHVIRRDCREAFPELPNGAPSAVAA